MIKVFTCDAETQLSDIEVSGWGNAHLMKVSVATGIMEDVSLAVTPEGDITFASNPIQYVYSDEPKELFIEMGYEPYQIKPVSAIVRDMDAADYVVTWNGIGFDYKVFMPYDEIGVIYPEGTTNPTVKNQTEEIVAKSIDMRALTRKGTGGFGKLEGAGQATLGRGKTEGGYGGLSALMWWKEYKRIDVEGDDFFSSTTDNRIQLPSGAKFRDPIEPLRDITTYCMGDTELTREIFWFGVKNGYILIDSFKEDVGVKRVTASWSETILGE